MDSMAGGTATQAASPSITRASASERVSKSTGSVVNAMTQSVMASFSSCTEDENLLQPYVDVGCPGNRLGRPCEDEPAVAQDPSGNPEPPPPAADLRRRDLLGRPDGECARRRDRVPRQ